ncbi:hypothetical protein SISSUDRAFT_1122452 [Sistotremastrum suecicum HHB10207 ss-3]|uniref:Uncharacterized protein n=1 Tax=Sistotremastrum suecicum HHB10207 ss-3 TaxID=1314776 RepID=A0A165ZBR8_9AGAM|nr:hypothetical protein SISSUDRAFT_1122452 [Sistotremastrum suecicum HHB10207 ss-3]
MLYASLSTRQIQKMQMPYEVMYQAAESDMLERPDAAMPLEFRQLKFACPEVWRLCQKCWSFDPSAGPNSTCAKEWLRQSPVYVASVKESGLFPFTLSNEEDPWAIFQQEIVDPENFLQDSIFKHAIASLVASNRLSSYQTNLSQLNELARRLGQNLEWRCSVSGPPHLPIWLAYPLVNRVPWTRFTQAGRSWPRALKSSADEVVRFFKMDSI